MNNKKQLKQSLLKGVDIKRLKRGDDLELTKTLSNSDQILIKTDKVLQVLDERLPKSA